LAEKNKEIIYGIKGNTHLKGILKYIINLEKYSLPSQQTGPTPL
jgi:hypothetical protein